MAIIPANERGSLIVFQRGTAATVVVYGIFHDQWLMSVSPEHFSVYHDTLIATGLPRVNTAELAFVATLGPGLVLGCLLWTIARLGAEPTRLLFGCVWKKLIVLLICIDVFAASIGLLSAFLFKARGEAGLLLPTWMFPELRADLVIAQTIQMYTYVAAAIGSALLLWLIRCARRNMRSGLTNDSNH
ncbi:MAG: hypothetical protein K1X78_07860 [Verrucomicrobiaceae bacterium]|nr:hypothetical protein [Verrucomicrobiaceae bacterium]